MPLALQGLVRAQEHLSWCSAVKALSSASPPSCWTWPSARGGLDSLELLMSRTDIADYLGLTIEAVSRVFSRLKEKGAIRLISLRVIEIRKWQVLRGMMECRPLPSGNVQATRRISGTRT